jgi:hypothetical protein
MVCTGKFTNKETFSKLYGICAHLEVLGAGEEFISKIAAH